MIEKLDTEIIKPDIEGTILHFEIAIETYENLIHIYLDGELVGSGDWNGNIKEFFERAVELWGNVDEI